MLITDPEPGIRKCGALERSGNKIDLTKAKTKIGRKKIVGEKAKKKNRRESNCLGNVV
jgi:hypothetical protein